MIFTIPFIKETKKKTHHEDGAVSASSTVVWRHLDTI